MLQLLKQFLIASCARDGLRSTLVQRSSGCSIPMTPATPHKGDCAIETDSMLSPAACVPDRHKPQPGNSSPIQVCQGLNEIQCAEASNFLGLLDRAECSISSADDESAPHK